MGREILLTFYLQLIFIIIDPLHTECSNLAEDICNHENNMLSLLSTDFVAVHAHGHEYIYTCIFVYVYIPKYNIKFQAC